MIQALSTTASKNSDAVTEAESEDYVTFVIESQMFGIPVVSVQDILIPEDITPIPLAPPEVKGAINLRGRVVTVIDVRKRLGPADTRLGRMHGGHRRASKRGLHAAGGQNRRRHQPVQGSL